MQHPKKEEFQEIRYRLDMSTIQLLMSIDLFHLFRVIMVGNKNGFLSVVNTSIIENDRISGYELVHFSLKTHLISNLETS
jgi:hypothetical protein